MVGSPSPTNRGRPSGTCAGSHRNPYPCWLKDGGEKAVARRPGSSRGAQTAAAVAEGSGGNRGGGGTGGGGGGACGGGAACGGGGACGGGAVALPRARGGRQPRDSSRAPVDDVGDGRRASCARAHAASAERRSTPSAMARPQHTAPHSTAARTPNRGSIHLGRQHPERVASSAQGRARASATALLQPLAWKADSSSTTRRRRTRARPSTTRRRRPGGALGRDQGAAAGRLGRDMVLEAALSGTSSPS